MAKSRKFARKLRRRSRKSIARRAPSRCKMTDENGKQTEKTFRLVEESEYLDSTGRVAVLDVFQSGDDILFIEADGRIKSMKKGAISKPRPGQRKRPTKRATRSSAFRKMGGRASVDELLNDWAVRRPRRHR